MKKSLIFLILMFLSCPFLYGASIELSTYSGNIGIGTTAQQKVDIYGVSPLIMFKDSSNTANNRRWLIGAIDNGFANSTNFFIQSSLDNGVTMSPDFFMWPAYAVGIGTFDLDGRLTIMGRGTGDTRSLQIKNSAGSTYFDVYDNGNVGIGTTTAPRSRLDIGSGQLTAGSINLPSGEGYFTSTAGMYFDPDGSGPLLRLSQGRFVGIGTSSPSTTLELVKQGTNAPLMISSTATGDGDYLKILSNGNVGINTIEPKQKLETVGTIKATAFVGDGSGLTGISAGGWTDGGTNVYNSTTTDTVGIGTTNASGTLEIVKQGSSVPLMVSATATGDGNYLIVNSAGNVGMGTVLPSAILDVVSANYPVAEFTRTSSATNTVSGAIKYKALSSATVADGFGVNFGAFIEGSGLAETQIGELAFIRDGANNSGAITFRPYASGSANERARISSNGNFGIGTTSPQTPLQVSGDSKIGNGTFSNTSANEDLYVEGNLEVDGTLYIDSCSGAGCGAGGASGWTDGGTNVYTTATTDTVGIGTTTPSTTLEIVKQGSSAPLMVSSTATGDGNIMIITSAGNVGIGTLLPRGPLDLGPTGTLYTQTITGPTGPTILGTSNNVGIGTITAGSLLTVGSTGQVTVSSAGAIATSSTVSVADDAYAAGWNASTAVPTKNAVYDKIETLGSGGWTDGSAAVYPTTSTDNVGIGTVSPGKKLDLYGTDSDIRMNSTDTAQFTGFQFYNGTTQVGEFGAGGSTTSTPNQIFLEQVVPNAPIDFMNDTGIQLRIKGPNVGIGTTGSGGAIFVSPDGSCSKCGPNNADVWACASVTCL